MSSSPQNPLTTLENQDQRLRRDAVRATKYVSGQLSGTELRDFVEKLARFLRGFEEGQGAQGDSEGGIAC